MYAETQTQINGPYVRTELTLRECWEADLARMTDYNLLRENASAPMRPMLESWVHGNPTDRDVDAAEAHVWAIVDARGWYTRDSRVTRIAPLPAWDEAHDYERHEYLDAAIRLRYSLSDLDARGFDWSELYPVVAEPHDHSPLLNYVDGYGPIPDGCALVDAAYIVGLDDLERYAATHDMSGHRLQVMLPYDDDPDSDAELTDITWDEYQARKH